MRSFTKSQLLILLLTFLIAIKSQDPLPPPLWPETFTQQFVQGDEKAQIFVTGKLWYDAKNNRQRFDYRNDYFDLICQSIAQKPNTTCSQVTKNDTLYINLPDDNKCCKCCTKEEGCDIMPRDWLKHFEWSGIVPMLSWAYYNSWTHYDVGVNSTYYATVDGQNIPKKFEAGPFSTNFLVPTYTQDSISDGVFNLPQICEKDCPKALFCADFFSGKFSNNFLKKHVSIENKFKRNIMTDK